MIEIYETIENCRICSSKNIEEVLDLGDQPPANSLYKANNVPHSVPLRLMYCQDCSTVQLGEDVDPEYLFSQYLWVTGTSNTAIEYSYEFTKKALSQIDEEIVQPYVVEIASNDGTFLKRFLENGSKVLGVDPAKNIAELANKNGVPTNANFFTVELAKQLVNDEGEVDIAIARNVIPHVKEIHSVIEGMRKLLKDSGTGIIEFHNAGLILDELHYDYIYHEHLFYFTLKTITGLIHQHNMHVYDIIQSPISGGSWVVYFSKIEKAKSQVLVDIEQLEIEKDLNSYQRWIAFSDQVNQHAARLKEVVFQNNEKIPAYGASARSSTLLNFCGITSEHISIVLDKNPLKDGLITAGSNIPIVSFEDGIKKIKNQKKILLLAWNFQDEIVKELREFDFKGEFIIPLPGDPYIL
jgi:2-polyprenyl-3-methyl-5-hydroxy-6-metoxy-1,4-benzoquinol methylase